MTMTTKNDVARAGEEVLHPPTGSTASPVAPDAGEGDGLTDWDITDAMIVYGGSFVAGLGRLFRQADATNKERLKQAFPEYWAQYANRNMHRALRTTRRG